MNEFLMAFIGFAAGAAVGLFAGWLLMRDHGSRFRIAQENKTLKQQMDDYREQVDGHFVRTAELVNNLTQAYRAVHEELASGAQALCSEETRHLAVVKQALPEPQAPAEEPPIAPATPQAPSSSASDAPAGAEPATPASNDTPEQPA